MQGYEDAAHRRGPYTGGRGPEYGD
jgi:hypothetical protein